MRLDKVSPPPALAIYQDWNDQTAACLSQGDVAGSVKLCACPMTIQTEVRESIFESEDDISDQMAAISNFIRSHSVTDYVRIAQSAEFLGDSFIQGWHTTHILRNATYVVDPYTCVTVLEHRDNQWVCRQQTVSFTNNDVPILIPKPIRRENPKSDPNDVRSTNTDPVRIYQTFINALSKSNIEHDFEAWVHMCDFPHSVHTLASDEVMTAPQDFRTTFDEVSDLIQQHGATEMIRIATEAEFISADRICGYHEGILKRGEELIAGPVKSRMVIRRRQDGSWGLVAVTNSVLGLKSGDFKSATEELPSLIEIQNRYRQAT